MKTSLRERWQEVAEEIERTKIPEIHLLTVDEDKFFFVKFCNFFINEEF
jgi:hypothetical protein